MISAARTFGAGRGYPKAPRPASFAGGGNQALMAKFLEEFRKAQAKSCEQDVDEVKRGGVSGKLTGKQPEDRKKPSEKFTF